MKDQNSSKAVNDNEILYGLKNDQFQPFLPTKKVLKKKTLQNGNNLKFLYFVMPEIRRINVKMLQSHQSEEKFIRQRFQLHS